MKKINRKILVVAAHPDDEVLGMGATLCAHRDLGDKISILLLANGEDSRDKTNDPKKRFGQAKAVAKRLRAKLYLEDFPDNQFDAVPLLIIAKAIEKIISKVQPDLVYTHHIDDLNVDHRISCQAVLTACRPQPKFCVSEILSFEVLSSTEWQKRDYRSFMPNHYVDVSTLIAEKKILMGHYAHELRKYPHPRSLEGIDILAKYRGIEVGLPWAEAFHIIRKIIRSKNKRKR